MSDVNEPIGSGAETDAADSQERAAGADQSVSVSASDLGVSDGETVEMPAASAKSDVLNSGTGNPEEDDAAIDGVPNALDPDVTGANQVADAKDA